MYCKVKYFILLTSSLHGGEVFYCLEFLIEDELFPHNPHLSLSSIRYMDGGNSMNYGNGGYYAGGSNTKEELQKLMDRATNETEKEAIRVAIESMNN